jgi:hypothetical protein
MSIKCKELTSAQLRRYYHKPGPVSHNITNPLGHLNKSKPSLNRWIQLRKRSLTSMGWRYHL